MKLAVLLLTVLVLPIVAHAAYEEIAVTDGGTLAGVVRFSGTPPKLAPLAVNKNRDVCGDAKPAEALVVGADRGVRGSVVYVEGITRGKKRDGEVVIDNELVQTIPATRSVGGLLNATAGLTVRLHMVSFNSDVTGEGTFDTSTSRCAYPNSVRYGPGARLHLSWCWRENPPDEPLDLRTNHDLCYAYSDDFGRTWKNNLGAEIGQHLPGPGAGQDTRKLNDLDTGEGRACVHSNAPRLYRRKASVNRDNAGNHEARLTEQRMIVRSGSFLAPDAQHDEVALLARAHAQLRQRLGTPAQLRGRGTFDHQRTQRAAAMRIGQSGHVFQAPREFRSATTLA